MRDEIFSWDRHPEPILHGDPPEQPTLPVVQRDEARWRAPGLDTDFVVDVPALFRTP